MSTTTKRGALAIMGETTPTDYWNDSCSVQELEYGLASGAVGATTNPVIVLGVLKKEMHLWKERIRDIIRENPEGSEDQIAWQLIEEMAIKGAQMLMPVFEREQGRKGRLSIQTDPKLYRNWKAILGQTLHFQTLAPNIQVKIPVTAAGVRAIEEATYNGVSINATVCFTVPQSLAVAEAVERGLARRKSEGLETAVIAPVCTIMVGRVDDWLKVVADKQDIITNPDYLEWAGVAVMKHAYELFRKKGYSTRLLAAAYRNHYHWSEFIGADMVLTIPYTWAKRFNESDVKVESRINNPVNPELIAELSRKFPDFVRAYDERGMSVDEFDGYGATVRTLRSFIGGYQELVALIRDFMIPNPDLK